MLLNKIPDDRDNTIIERYNDICRGVLEIEATRSSEPSDEREPA